jgi:hypothetical protein
MQLTWTAGRTLLGKDQRCICSCSGSSQVRHLHLYLVLRHRARVAARGGAHWRIPRVSCEHSLPRCRTRFSSKLSAMSHTTVPYLQIAQARVAAVAWLS